MRLQRNPYIRVNLCWEVKNERKCATLPKEQAYVTRKWAEKEGGCVWWFQALPD